MKKRGQQFASQVQNTIQVEPIPSRFPFVTRPDYMIEQKKELIDVLT